MKTPKPSQRIPLSVDQITAAALELIDRDGVGGLSMRKLGAALGVDPMAVYHHVDDRDTLVALTMARVLRDLPNSDTSLTWDSRVRRWAVAYRRVVVTHRALTYEAMRSPATVELAAAEGTRPLVEAIADSGVSSREANEFADLIVDYVHGHALAVTDDRPRATPRAFTRSIDTIIEGIRVRAH